MIKKIIKIKFKKASFCSLLAIGLALVSCKDDFSEEDLLNAQQVTNYSVMVFNASADDKAGISGATVTINQNGNLASATTDERGIVTFSGTAYGYFSISVKAEGYPSGSGAVRLIKNSDEEIGQALTKFPMFSMTENTARITGKITYFNTEAVETQLIPNDLLNVEIQIYTPDSDFDNGFNLNENFGRLESVIYEGLEAKVTDGIYDITVPSGSSNGYEVPYTIKIPEIIIGDREFGGGRQSTDIDPGEVHQFNYDYGSGSIING